MKLYMFRRVRL